MTLNIDENEAKVLIEALKLYELWTRKQIALEQVTDLATKIENIQTAQELRITLGDK